MIRSVVSALGLVVLKIEDKIDHNALHDGSEYVEKDARYLCLCVVASVVWIPDSSNCEKNGIRIGSYME